MHDGARIPGPPSVREAVPVASLPDLEFFRCEDVKVTISPLSVIHATRCASTVARNSAAVVSFRISA